MIIFTKCTAKSGAILSLVYQVVILILGFVIPRLVIVSYGSETNGLLTTVTQIFTYIALLEAGIGNASINALYKPIVNGDFVKINHVYSSTKRYFHKMTYIYGLCVVILSLLYPMVVTSTLDYFTIAMVIFLHGISGAVTFLFSAAYRQLIIADGKYYIISTINVIVYIVSSIGKILLINLGYNMVILMSFNFLISCFQAALFIKIIKQCYPYLKEVSTPNMSILSERNAFVVHEISSIIFSSTDAIIISTFCNFKLTSVYIIYNMVFASLASLINSVDSSLNYILGHIWASGNKIKYIKVHDMYESLYIAVMFTVFTVAYILILPFVSLYTAGITDIEYIDTLLPILFCGVQLLSCVRAVSSRLINISGHATDTKKRSIAEAIINLLSSIFLVNLIGIYGVILGTIIALLYRSNDIIIYANRKILNRSVGKIYKKIFFNSFTFSIIAYYMHFCSNKMLKICDTYFMFVVYGLILTPIMAVAYLLIAVLTEKELYIELKKLLAAKCII